jgi:hypothetical protein
MTLAMICCSVRGSHTIHPADCTPRLFSQCLHPYPAEAMPGQGSTLFHGSVRTRLWGDDVLLKHALAVGDLASHCLWGILSREFLLPPWGEPAVRLIPASATYCAGAIDFVGLAKHTAGGRCPAGASCADHPQFRMPSGSAPHVLRFIVRAGCCTSPGRCLSTDTRR